MLMCGRAWHRLASHCVVLCHDAMQCDAVRCDAMRCDAMQCDAMQCNAMRDAMRCDATQREELCGIEGSWKSMRHRAAARRDATRRDATRRDATRREALGVLEEALGVLEGTLNLTKTPEIRKQCCKSRMESLIW